MTALQRAALLIGAVVALAVAFVALRPADDEPGTTAVVTTTVPSTATPRTVSTASVPKPKPKPPLLTSAKVTELEVEQGDTVRFRARSATDDEVHVHGYDQSRAAPAGKTIEMSFTATLEGIFEIEFENAGVEIAKLTVTP
ncbi:MAG: hypothetical protein JHC84_02355 [Solirubrobacteraceae bacterium]|nr:hypothetical protein [Solirubrobacteraceae bacterium]